MLRQRRGIGGNSDTMLPLHRQGDATAATRRKPLSRVQSQNRIYTGTGCLAVLLLVLLLVSVSVRLKNGIGTNAVIQCSDGSFGILDDDYCDCPDGVDEMNTAACSNILVQNRTFRCHDGTMIFSSRVKDNVYDCPDKSDEF
jgi:Glucosidase II beta subunit-like